MILRPMEEWEKPFFSERIHACPRRTHSTSFQLVDERGMAGPMPAWLMKSAILRRLSTLVFWTKQGQAESIGTIAGRWFLSSLKPIKGVRRATRFAKRGHITRSPSLNCKCVPRRPAL